MNSESNQGLRIYQSPRTAARIIDGQAVVVVIDENRLHTLNATGTRLWERCTGAAMDELVGCLMSEYGISREVAARDVGAFIQQMRDVGAVELREI